MLCTSSHRYCCVNYLDEVTMKLNDPDRNRRAGFFGVAVATLLTPGGKLFTSAMAAAVTIAAVVSNMDSSQDPAGPSSAAIDTGALEAPGKTVDISDLPTTGDTQMLSAETLVEDPTAAPGMPAAFTSQNMSSGNLTGTNIAGIAVSNAGGGSESIIPLPPRDPSDPKCTPVLLSELDPNTELPKDEIICLEDFKKSKKGNPESTAGKNGDPESTGEPESTGGPGSEPLVIALAPFSPEPELSPEIVGPTPEETPIPNDAPTFQPLLIQPLASVAAVPEPTTLALLGLGLLGFAQVYRKNKHQK